MTGSQQLSPLKENRAWERKLGEEEEQPDHLPCWNRAVCHHMCMLWGLRDAVLGREVTSSCNKLIIVVQIETVV